MLIFFFGWSHESNANAGKIVWPRLFSTFHSCLRARVFSFSFVESFIFLFLLRWQMTDKITALMSNVNRLVLMRARARECICLVYILSLYLNIIILCEWIFSLLPLFRSHLNSFFFPFCMGVRMKSIYLDVETMETRPMCIINYGTHSFVCLLSLFFSLYLLETFCSLCPPFDVIKFKIYVTHFNYPTWWHQQSSLFH